MEREGRCRIGMSPSAFDPSLRSTINHPSWIGFILTWIQAPFQQQRHIHSVLHACRNTCCPTWIQAPPLLCTHTKAHTASHMHVGIKSFIPTCAKHPLAHAKNTHSFTYQCWFIRFVPTWMQSPLPHLNPTAYPSPQIPSAWNINHCLSRCPRVPA